MKLITLMENTALTPAFRCEHGLSLYLETGSRKLLFDFGQTAAFAENAEKLGVDLSRVDTAILSHGHYDHGGGISRFLNVNASAPVYINPNAFQPHYNGARYNGLDTALAGHPRLLPAEDGTNLGPGLTLYTGPRYEGDPGALNLGEGRPEDFRHEQYLLVEEGGRRILLSGCSHKGIAAIAAHFRPDILIGGFHLMKEEREEVLAETALALKALPTIYYTGHCTGSRQYEVMKTHLGSRLRPISAGTVLDL